MKLSLGTGIATLGLAVAIAVPQSAGAEPPAAAAKGKATLFVSASGFEGTEGQAIVAVYATKDSWLKVDRAYRVQKSKITGGTLVASFSEIPPGLYAVSVIHDANANGKIDMHWLPIPGPDEGAGVSNDAKATFGPPSFDDARFRLGEPTGVVAVKIRY